MPSKQCTSKFIMSCDVERLLSMGDSRKIDEKKSVEAQWGKKRKEKITCAHTHIYIKNAFPLFYCFSTLLFYWCAWMETSWYRMFMISIDFRRFSVKRSKSDNIKKNNLSVLMLVFSSYWNLLCCHFVLSLTFTRIVFITAGVFSVSYSSAYVWIVWCFVCQCMCVCVYMCLYRLKHAIFTITKSVCLWFIFRNRRLFFYSCFLSLSLYRRAKKNMSYIEKKQS